MANVQVSDDDIALDEMTMSMFNVFSLEYILGYSVGTREFQETTAEININNVSSSSCQWQSYRFISILHIVYEHLEQQIELTLVGSHPLWAHHLWNSARRFAQVLDDTPLCKNKTVLELGSGSGLPSIIAASTGAKTVFPRMINVLYDEKVYRWWLRIILTRI